MWFEHVFLFHMVSNCEREGSNETLGFCSSENLDCGRLGYEAM